MEKRGQVSLEYLMIVGFVIAVLIPTSILAYNDFKEKEDIIRVRQAEQAAYAIVKEAESVYYLGPPSISTMEVYLPDQIFDIYVANYDFTIRVHTKHGIEDVSVPSKVNITGMLSETQGVHRVRLSAQGAYVEVIG
ncbi:MAG: hypothetical protein ACOCWQ_01825 [Nanoarchaeota archaeon]